MDEWCRNWQRSAMLRRDGARQRARGSMVDIFRIVCIYKRKTQKDCIQSHCRLCLILNVYILKIADMGHCIEPSEFDLVVIGTGLIESIVAAYVICNRLVPFHHIFSHTTPPTTVLQQNQDDLSFKSTQPGITVARGPPFPSPTFPPSFQIHRLLVALPMPTFITNMQVTLQQQRAINTPSTWHLPTSSTALVP